MMNSILSSNRYLISFYSLIALLFISFSCVWHNDNCSTGGEGDDHCIGSLFQRLGTLLYLWEWFPSWPNFHVFPSFVGWSAAFGVAMGLFTWTVIKMDSSLPGICPPSPLSPKKIRSASGHDFHLCYVLAIVNGVTLGILYMGIDSG